MIQIYTFGTLQVVRDAETAEPHHVAESDWHTRQARQLLKILLTERPRPVSTDRLIDILWPDSTAKAAGTTLRSAINALRNVLEPDRPKRAPSKFIITQTPGYAFRHHAEIWLDVAEFERLLSAAKENTDPAQQRALLEEATALYQDDYLTSDPYADWARTERERLVERYFTALLDLAALYAAAAEYGAAIAACRQILARDPVRERAYQAMMRYQAESGDSAAALLTYERCRTLLAEELGADPSPVTQMLHQRILNGEVGSAGLATDSSSQAPNVAEQNGRSATPSAEQTATPATQALVLPLQTSLPAVGAQAAALDEHHFVGRTEELAFIRQQMQDAQTRQGNLLFIEGEAGVGKTYLVQHLLQEAISGRLSVTEPNGVTEDAGPLPQPFTVIHATCQPLEQELPFAPLGDSLGRFLHTLPLAAIQALPATSLAQLAQLIPTLQDRLPELPVLPIEAWANSDENRQRLINGIIAVLVALAEARPLLLFLDDLHWADAETLALLGRLRQHLDSLPMLVLLAYRDSDVDTNKALRTLLDTLQPTRYHPTDPQTKRASLSAQTVVRQRPLQLQIQQFDRHEISALAGRLSGQTVAADAQLVTMLQRTTHGNALFVMEALRALEERADIEPTLNWMDLLQPFAQEQDALPNDVRQEARQELVEQVASVFQLGQNSRVQEVSLTRIRRLPPTARNLLYLCAVIGRDFSFELLEQVVQTQTQPEAQPETDLFADLELLLQRRFLMERPDERLDFCHEIVRQAAYESMFGLQQRRLHRQVAEALVASARAQEIAADIVYHYRQSGGGDQSLIAKYSVFAGERLFHTYSFRQAIGYFEDALTALQVDLTAPGNTVIKQAADVDWIERALLRRGLAYESLFDPEGVASGYSALHHWANARGNYPLLLMAYSRQSTMSALLGQVSKSNELLQELLDTLTNADDGAFGDEAVRRRGTDVIFDLFQRRRQILPPSISQPGADDDINTTQGDETIPTAWVAYQPPPPVVEAPVEAILAALPRVHAVMPLFDYGWLLLIQGQVAEAILCLQTVAELAQQTDQLTVAVLAYYQLAVAARMQDDMEQCHLYNQQSILLQRKLHPRAAGFVSLWPRIGSSMAALDGGALDDAEARLKGVIAQLHEISTFRNHYNSALVGLGLVALARQEFDQAEELILAALNESDPLYPYMHLRALLGLARVAAHHSQLTTARRYLQEAMRFAGESSLLEGYVDAIIACVALVPDAGPPPSLTQALLAYIEQAGLGNLQRKLDQLPDNGPRDA